MRNRAVKKLTNIITNLSHDTMDPKAMEEQSKMAMWDNQKVFMNGVIKFIKGVDAGI